MDNLQKFTGENEVKHEDQDLARFRTSDSQAESVSGVSQCGTEFCLFVSGVGGKNEPLT